MDRQAGQITPLALGMALVIFAVAGLAVDMTKAYLLRRTLQSAADSAALSGAGAVDVAAYYSSAGTNVSLEPDQARSAATQALARRGIPVTGTVAVQGRDVRVVLRGRSATLLLRLIGIAHLEVSAHSSARPGPGVAVP